MERRKIPKIVTKILGVLLAAGLLALVFFFGVWFGQSGGEGSSLSGGITRWQEGELRIHFLDVGQGDCTILELPDGKKMIIDGGDGSSEHEKTVLSYLSALQIETLDYMVVTHADEDHCGGLESVVDELEIVRAYLPYEATLSSGSTYLSLYRKVLAKAYTVDYSERYLHAEGENYFFAFLSPLEEAFQSEDENENSAVVWLDYNGVSALFTGDMTEDAEARLVSEYALADDIFDIQGLEVELDSTEILKVAHHGSNSSSSSSWLELLHFETAVISCGAGNAYGHPSSGALERLRAASPSAEIYRTDECGTVVVTSGGDGRYTTSYENQTQSQSASASETWNGLCNMAYIQKKLLRTEKGIVC